MRMTAPTKDDWNKLVKLGRYLVRYSQSGGQVVACTDSAWARNRRTRRSTSGGCIHRGQRVRKFWGKTRAVVALSSAEAELGAAVKASQEKLALEVENRFKTSGRMDA